MLYVGLTLVLASSGCTQQAAPPPSVPAVPVTVATVSQESMPIVLHAIGNVEAFRTVSIKAQVSAELMEIHIREGQDVKKGDLLFTLDKRPFEAALQQAQANLVKDKAQAEIARVQAQRYAKLFQEGVAPKEQYDQLKATADASDAAVIGDEAAVQYSRLQLQYCSIYSPIDGRTGALMLHTGNLTKANDVPILLVINQVNPIFVDFSIPEQYLAQVKQYMAAKKLTVQALLPGDAQHPESGSLSFIDNSVDATTGTIKLKGTFENPGRRLWPGQFVDAVLRLAEQENAIVVPSQAVQTGQEGQYVFVVKQGNTAESRKVVVTRSLDGRSVISKGLQPGETIITDGQLRLKDGTKVQVKTGSAGS